MLLHFTIWPTPDEYFYATITDAFDDILEGERSAGQLNTEHTYLFSVLHFIYTKIFNISDLMVGRTIMLLFAFGNFILLYLLAKKNKIKKEQRIWYLLLLLLIPGFWLFSVRLMLDIPAAFCVLLIIYLLINKSSPYKLSLALVLLLLIKEYYIFLMLPFVLFIYSLDIFTRKKNKVTKIKEIIRAGCILSLPSFFMSIVLIDFVFLPYPRLLENNLSYLFGDVFYFFNKIFVNIINFFNKIYNYITFANPTHQSTATGFSEAVERVSIIEYSGALPNSLKGVPAGDENKTFIEYLWGMYKTNYSDITINLLLLSFAVTGVVNKLKNLFKNFIKEYQQKRTDIIFLCLLLAFFLFGVYEMKHVSAFRVVLPIIFALIYFGYIGFEKIIENSKKSLYIFSVSSAFFILLFWLNFYNIEYTSLLSNQSIIDLAFKYKNYFFIGIYIFVILVLLFVKQKKFKKIFLVLVFIFFMASRFVPFYFEDKLLVDRYGFDYSVSEASDTLQELAQADDFMINSNYHRYKVQYYAHDTEIKNDMCYASARSFTNIIPRRYHNLEYDEYFQYKLIKRNIKYVFIVNTVGNQDEFDTITKDLDDNRFFKKKEEYYYHDQRQWVIYKFKNKKAFEYYKVKYSDDAS